MAVYAAMYSRKCTKNWDDSLTGIWGSVVCMAVYAAVTPGNVERIGMTLEFGVCSHRLQEM